MSSMPGMTMDAPVKANPKPKAAKKRPAQKAKAATAASAPASAAMPGMDHGAMPGMEHDKKAEVRASRCPPWTIRQMSHGKGCRRSRCDAGHETAR